MTAPTLGLEKTWRHEHTHLICRARKPKPGLRGVSIDPKQFRSVMGTFATGVAVIATEWRGELFGATINSLTSVSLDPCMLLVCTSEGSVTGTAIRNRGFFSVNILGQHQSELSARFTGNQQNRLRILP
jgi:3-hydroxy-9,10-secoandrosta-1,3,5(10)-triene-9,17-dione monooxygenase reductase component